MQFYLIHFPFSLLECKNSPVLICNRTRLDLWKFIPLVSVTPWTTHILHPTHLHTERWFAGPQPFQILNSIQPLYCKLGLLIIKVPKVPLHHVPKPSAPLRKSINKRTLKEPAIKYISGVIESVLSSIYPMTATLLVQKQQLEKKREERGLVVVLPPKFAVTYYMPISCSRVSSHQAPSYIYTQVRSYTVEFSTSFFVFFIISQQKKST